ncbi:MAG TPA: DUF2905 domain-containing protein [Candidatus Marinimicrobia bacterium]|nr:DUF2905 domain-containing protein [Candidatus Neomarinimicrobiota bacterium]HIC74699.1 DUF2905 domain-containing protein [Candidatus Neomarinimicrobiota bacterium]
MGKILLILSIVFFVMWLLTSFGSNLPLLGKLGHLPGDLHFNRGNFTFYLPIGSSILLSIFLTLVLRLFSRI